ncbi:hypothetical protein J6590_070923, partial [Homalodisca vitripennis]
TPSKLKKFSKDNKSLFPEFNPRFLYGIAINEEVVEGWENGWISRISFSYFSFEPGLTHLHQAVDLLHSMSALSTAPTATRPGRRFWPQSTVAVPRRSSPPIPGRACRNGRVSFDCVYFEYTKIPVHAGLVWSVRSGCRLCAQITLEDFMKKNVKVGLLYGTLSHKLDENAKAVEEQTDSLEKGFRMIDELAAENRNLGVKLSSLEIRIDDLEQYSRVNSVKINGIRQQKNEGVAGVREVGKALGVRVAD